MEEGKPLLQVLKDYLENRAQALEVRHGELKWFLCEVVMPGGGKRYNWYTAKQLASMTRRGVTGTCFEEQWSAEHPDKEYTE